MKVGPRWYRLTPEEAEAQGSSVIPLTSHSVLWVRLKLVSCAPRGFLSISPLDHVGVQSVDFEVRQLCVQIPAQPLGHGSSVSNLNFLSLILHR